MPIATNDKGDTVFLDSDGAWKPATLAEHPETKQRLAFDGTDWKPLSPKTTTGEAWGRGIMQSASFGFRDEGQGLIEAGGGGGGGDTDALTNLGYLARGAYRKLTGDPEAEARYKAAVERERASTKQIEQERPGAYFGGNVLGAVTMPIGFAARAPTFASRLIAGAKTGAAAGALTGFGEGEGLEGSLKGAAIGAPVGGLVGGASVPVVEGLARGAGAAISYPYSVARGLLTPGAASERAVGRALQQAERSDPTGANRITQRQFQAGPGDAVVGDVLGEPGRKLARSAANISPEARETMNIALNARGEAQGARATDWLDTQFSFPNAHAQQQALDATRRSATGAAYETAERQGASGLWSPELERLASSQGVAGAMKTAVQTSQDEAVRRGMGGFNPKISFTPDGRIQFNRGPNGVPTYPDLRYWDQVRRELSDAAQKAGRGTEEHMRLSGLATALNTELDRMVPAYQVARRTAAGFFDARDALEAGQNFATQRFANDEARAALAGMNQTERALFRDGYISRMKDVLGATKDNRDITKILGASAEDRAKLTIALGPQRAREFQALLHAESIMQKLKEAVQGNSSTVMQLLGAGAAGAGGGGYLGFDPTTSGIGSAVALGLKKGADANMARHITRLMMSQDPAVLQAGIRQIARNARNLEILQRVSNAVARAAAQQTVERLPRMQYGGRPTGPTVVGEDGPEVFVPDEPGTIVPNPFELAAARTRRRYPTREPDPASLAASQGRGASWERFLPSEERALQAAGELQRGGDYNPRDVLLSAIGATAAPVAGPAQGATLGAGAIKPIRAYHGSPHDFERFDLSKIGTGEGAQAYGHGLYFAENPATAKAYRDSLTPTYYYEAGRKLGPAEQNAASMLLDHGYTKEQALDYINKSLRPGKFADQAYLDQTAEALKRIDPAAITREAKGRMYEVNINAAPEQFLDWDKGGQKIYQDALWAHGGRSTLSDQGQGAAQASAALARKGIPGIKYLDQGSRFNQALFNDNPIANEARKFIEAAGGNSEKAGEAFYKSNPVERWAAPERDEIFKLIQTGGNKGTSNYVLFRDDIIDIVKKYGLAGAAAMVGISQDEARAAMGRGRPKEATP